MFPLLFPLQNVPPESWQTGGVFLFSLNDPTILRSLDTLAESIPSGITIVDHSGKIIFCNAEMEKMFGYDKGELTNASIEQLVPAHLREAHIKYRREFSAKEEKRQMGAGRDLSGRRKDGSEFPVEIGLNPIHLQEGSFVLAAITDITTRKKVETQLRKAYNELQMKNDEMEQFIYSVSHELKAPLVTSTSFIKFLKEDFSTQNYSEMNDILNRLEKANNRIQEYITDLLNFSRIGKMVLSLQNINLNMIVGDMLEDYRLELEKKHIKVEAAKDLPTVLTDIKHITQVFENLLRNAINYGSTATEPKIQIFWRENNNEYQICFKDNGEGIDPLYHKKIFGLFQRLSHDQQGTGAGLAIVSRIMQLHGGRVWVESQLGQGAEFWLALPKARKE